MDSIKAIFESLKLTLYEWLAILLPGFAAVECVRLLVLPIKNVLPGSTAPDSGAATFAGGVIAYLIVSYLAGLSLQGLSALLVETPMRRLPVRGSIAGVTNSKEAARRVARSLLNYEPTDDLLISFCLSRVEGKRTAYDRFVALRDMSRALALVSFAGAFCIVFAKPERVASSHKAWLFLGALIATLGFVERFVRYRPMAHEALFGLFLSGETSGPPKQL